MNRTVTIAPVRKSVVVNADAALAFEVFTSRIDMWWPKSHGIGRTPLAESIIEPSVGGRWYARCEDGTEVTNGHVIVWEPAKRVVFSWEVTAQWKPASTALSEVEVRFITRTPRSHPCPSSSTYFRRARAPSRCSSSPIILASIARSTTST
jgi:uncharacterized protein YndB with AHSA1/START domain